MDTVEALRNRVHPPEPLVARGNKFAKKLDNLAEGLSKPILEKKSKVKSLSPTKWDVSLHPRGKDGQWIEKGGPVKVSFFGKPDRKGKALLVRPGHGGGMDVQVDFGDGKPQWVHQNAISSAKKHKAKVSLASDPTTDREPMMVFPKADTSAESILDARIADYEERRAAWNLLPADEAELLRLRVRRQRGGLPVAASGTNEGTTMMNAEELRSRVRPEPVTAGVARKIAKAIGKWDSALHPRGKDGTWIEKDGPVEVGGVGGGKRRGIAVGVRNSPKGNGMEIQVDFGDNKPPTWHDTNVVTPGADAKANINPLNDAQKNRLTKGQADLPTVPMDETHDALGRKKPSTKITKNGKPLVEGMTLVDSGGNKYRVTSVYPSGAFDMRSDQVQGQTLHQNASKAKLYDSFGAVPKKKPVKASGADEGTTAEELRSRVHTPEPMTAGILKKIAHAIGKWDTNLHPRGKNGQWIEKDGPVDVTDGMGGRTRPGTAIGVRSTRDGGMEVEVDFGRGGKPEWHPTERVSAGSLKKASLSDKPDVDLDRERDDKNLADLRIGAKQTGDWNAYYDEADRIALKRDPEAGPRNDAARALRERVRPGGKDRDAVYDTVTDADGKQRLKAKRGGDKGQDLGTINKTVDTDVKKSRNQFVEHNERLTPEENGTLEQARKEVDGTGLTDETYAKLETFRGKNDSADREIDAIYEEADAVAAGRPKPVDYRTPEERRLAGDTSKPDKMRKHLSPERLAVYDEARAAGLSSSEANWAVSDADKTGNRTTTGPGLPTNEAEADVLRGRIQAFRDRKSGGDKAPIEKNNDGLMQRLAKGRADSAAKDKTPFPRQAEIDEIWARPEKKADAFGGELSVEDQDRMIKLLEEKDATTGLGGMSDRADLANLKKLQAKRNGGGGTDLDTPRNNSLAAAKPFNSRNGDVAGGGDDFVNEDDRDFHVDSVNPDGTFTVSGDGDTYDVDATFFDGMKRVKEGGGGETDLTPDGKYRLTPEENGALYSALQEVDGQNGLSDETRAKLDALRGKNASADRAIDKIYEKQAEKDKPFNMLETLGQEGGTPSDIPLDTAGNPVDTPALYHQMDKYDQDAVQKAIENKRANSPGEEDIWGQLGELLADPKQPPLNAAERENLRVALDEHVGNLLGDNREADAEQLAGAMTWLGLDSPDNVSTGYVRKKPVRASGETALELRARVYSGLTAGAIKRITEIKTIEFAEGDDDEHECGCGGSDHPEHSAAVIGLDVDAGLPDPGYVDTPMELGGLELAEEESLLDDPYALRAAAISNALPARNSDGEIIGYYRPKVSRGKIYREWVKEES